LNVVNRFHQYTFVLLTVIFAIVTGCGQEGEESLREKTGTAVSVASISPTPAPVPEPTPEPDDELRTLRNEGCATLDNDDFKVAIGYFERCCELSDDAGTDVANLGMALYGDGQFEAAELKLREALREDPNNPTILYHLGLTCKKLQKLEDAREFLTRVTEIDPTDATTFYQLGTVLDQMGNEDEAERTFKKTIEIDPIHASSYYRLMALYRKQRRRDEMKQAMEAFQTLRKTVPDSTRTEKELEKGKYSGAIWPSFGSEGSPLVEPPETRFVEITSFLEGSTPPIEGEISGARIVLADINRDTLMDFLVVVEGGTSRASSLRLFMNRGDFGFEVSAISWNDGQSSPVSDALFGDHDKDGYRDLFVVGSGVTAFKNQRGELLPATDIIGLPTTTVYSRGLPVDEDHDGDLDVLLVRHLEHPDTEPPVELYRYDGSGQFTGVTDSAGLSEMGGTAVNDLVTFDADQDDDIDILFATTQGPVLFSNLRQGRFTDVTQEAGLSGLAATAACDVADINHDGLMDIVLEQDGDIVILCNEGAGKFSKSEQSGGLGLGTAGISVRSLNLADLNGDGNQDLIVVAEAEPSVQSRLLLFFGDSKGGFENRTGDVIDSPIEGDLCSCIAEDLDQDGDPELLVFDRETGLRIFRNDTQGVRWVSVMLHGTKNCTEGVGTKVETRVRDSYQKIHAKRELVRFGVGGMPGVDVLRLQWPNGVLQGATQVAAGEIYHATEREGEIGSCPYLYTWNGEEFIFVTDVIDTSPLGLLIGQDQVFPPRGFEVVRITSEQLKPRDGALLLRFTEELRELTYFDEVWLEAIDHPADTEVYPDERFSMPPFPSGEPIVVSNAHPPKAAWDADGKDVLTTVSHLDHDYPEPGKRICYTGFTEGQRLVLDLGDVQKEERVLLLLTGYLRWGYSSSLYAISQDPYVPGQWPSFSVIDEDGSWKEILPNHGFPAGKMKTIPVDLTGRFPTPDCRVRIETNMEIYWDRILVDTSSELPDIQRTRVPLAAAHLHPRGYCRQSIIDGKALSIPDYGTYDPVPPFPLQVGRFTRYGDVTQLLRTADDNLVVFNQGDEVALAFNSEGLPAPPEGWNRTYFVHVIGWVKDGDINTVTGATVEPMPFRSMKAYPYSDEEAVAGLSPLQTRRVTEAIPKLRR